MKPLRHISRLPKTDIMAYEIHSSWWARLMPFRWAQKLGGKYFAWKVGRKYARYERSLEERDGIRKMMREDHGEHPREGT